ncbi:M20 family metallopeptidase [Nocardiopsis sediminis]|uniref:M20 family metallopeptidase n=1 Tax=Nocardiopsis sediminis TaxID=1778267 RepID=A0ABV8FID8_9ACTN
MPHTAALATWLGEHRAGILDDIRTLVERESPSADKALLDAAADHLTAWLPERLGATPAETVRRRAEDHGDVVETVITGTTPTTVLLVGHYDTVWPAGTIEGWPFTVNGDTATGPGVFDMKSGIVQGVWALRALRELGLPRPTVRFLFNGDEELGSAWSRPHVERASAGVAATIVTEPGGGWAAKTHRKGTGIFTVTAEGVESHAGLDPARGASAIHGLSDAVQTLVDAADLDRGTSVNIGTITGGTARNVIAGHASCLIDIRVTDTAEMERLDKVFAALRPRDARVRLTVGGGWNRPPMTPGAESRRLFEIADTVATDLRGPLGQPHVGGGSDANFIAALGRPVLCGMGAMGDGAHARHEHITVPDIPDRTALLAGTLLRLAEG